MDDLEFKSIDAAEFKFDDAGNGSFSGYGSVFGNVDSYRDVVLPGAYTDTVTDFLKSGFVAVGHDWGSTPVAYPTEAREDDYGFRFSAAFHSTDEAQAARRVMRERLDAGKTVGLSIGYRVKESNDREDGVRELVKLDLFEVSIVTVPANRAAVVVGAKSGSRAGLPFAEHSEAVRAAVEEYVVRAKAIAGLRAKEGRVLSAVTRARIAESRESIEEAVSALVDVDADLADLLAATLPAPKSEPTPDTLAATRQVYAEFLRSISA